jgi:hypothetical protein
MVTLMLQLFGGIVVGSIGYPFCVTITQSVFSKMLGPRPQVTSLSRISTRDSAVSAFKSVCRRQNVENLVEPKFHGVRSLVIINVFKNMSQNELRKN